jgi:hypothetical protein
VLDGGRTAPGPRTVGPAAARPRVTLSRTEQRPEIDGQLADEVWETAARIDRFVQRQPREGEPATEATEVFITYDSQHIYIGIRAHYSDPALIRANRSQRDQINQDDTVSVIVDPFLDQQRAYVFSVNGYGVQGDSLLTGGGGGGRGGGGRGGGGGGGGMGDSSWDALFSSAGRLVEDGWTAEMAIPFKSLRYPARDDGETHRWGFQVQRTIESKDETVVWSPVWRNEASFLAQTGTLDGMTALSASRNLELLPTFTAVSASALDADTGVTRRDSQPDGGMDLKYGVTSNMTLNFTVNPDFSQIESDRQQIAVNQRFPLFFSEQRPFFLEGQEIFSVSGPATFIHTRTIVDPQWGAKFTGKAGRTSFGVLAANDSAPGNLEDATDPAFDQTAQFFIGRVRHDLYAESSIGAIVTNREFLDRYSRVGGFDGNFRLGRTHRLSFLAVFSDHRDRLGVARTGNIYNLSFSRQGRGLTYSASTSGIDPNFRTDVGFVRRTDVRQSRTGMGYSWYPESWIVNWGPSLDYARTYNYDGVLEDEELQGGVDVRFARNISVNTSVSREMERFGDINFEKTRYRVSGNVNASRAFGISVGVSGGDQVRYVDDPFLGSGSGVNVNVTLRPSSRLESRLSVNTSRFVDTRFDEQLYHVKTFRSTTSYQFSERLSLRSILEHNTFDRTFGANLLATYRVNAGTVFFIGYDDRYLQSNRINDTLFPSTDYRSTNRAVFMKLQYLFRL